MLHIEVVITCISVVRALSSEAGSFCTRLLRQIPRPATLVWLHARPSAYLFSETHKRQPSPASWAHQGAPAHERGRHVSEGHRQDQGELQ